jgi:Sec-independent protein translocase protein TatA
MALCILLLREHVPKLTKLHAEQLREYREAHKNLSAKYMRNYRKRKAQEKGQENKHQKHLRQLPLHNYN